MVLWLKSFMKGVPVYLTLPSDIPKDLTCLTRSLTGGGRKMRAKVKDLATDLVGIGCAVEEGVVTESKKDRLSL
jgi:hypothetical protein